MQAREGLQASTRCGREASVFISSLVLCIDSKVGINMLETFDVDFDGVTETTESKIAREVVVKTHNLVGAVIEGIKACALLVVVAFHIDPGSFSKRDGAAKGVLIVDASCLSEESFVDRSDDVVVSFSEVGKSCVIDMLFDEYGLRESTKKEVMRRDTSSCCRDSILSMVGETEIEIPVGCNAVRSSELDE